MDMRDMLTASTSAHAVFFLLIGYIEALRWRDAGTALPDTIARLPLDGTPDLAARHAEACTLSSRCEGETGRPEPLLGEIADVFAAALERLRVLDSQWSRAA